MSIEKSYTEAMVEIGKKYPVLKEPIDTKVQVRVRQLMEIGRLFHAKGYKDNDPLSSFGFGDLFKK